MVTYNKDTLLYFLLPIIALGIWYGILNFKNSVVVLEHKTEEIKKEIKKEQARMNILKAELCYISRPQRIRHLTEKHLKSLGQTKAEQIVKNVKDNPKKYQTPIRKVVSKKVENIKWNFKT